jgi:hypothetical protein
MADYTTNLKDWASTGQPWPTDYKYTVDEAPIDVYDNNFNYNTIKDIKHLIALTNSRIESEKGSTKPSTPESEHLFIDSDDGKFHWYGNGSWSRVFDADGDTLGGTLDADGNQLANVGSITALDGTTFFDGSKVLADKVQSTGLDADSVDGWDKADIQSWVNGNADVPNADYADSAGDANTLQGNSPTDLSTDIQDDGVTVAAGATEIDFDRDFAVTQPSSGTARVTVESVNGISADELTKPGLVTFRNLDTIGGFTDEHVFHYQHDGSSSMSWEIYDVMSTYFDANAAEWKLSADFRVQVSWSNNGVSHNQTFNDSAGQAWELTNLTGGLSTTDDYLQIKMVNRTGYDIQPGDAHVAMHFDLS